MYRHLNVDCWNHVFECMREDHGSLLQLILVNRAMFRAVAPVLYRRPLLEFEDLNERSNRALEKLFLDKFGLRFDLTRSVIFEEIGAKIPKTTVDYYSLVQEMPDRPICLRRLLYYSASSRETQGLYTRAFAPKIKKFDFAMEEPMLMNRCIPLLSNLKEIHFTQLLDDVDKPTPRDSYDTVRNAIATHREAFPGLLKQVSFVRIEGNMERSNDARMMYVIREAMGGEWSTDRLALKLPVVMDDVHALMILKETELPTQLKSVEIGPVRRGNVWSNWAKPVSVFLSRCQALDSIKLHGCPADAFAWADKQQMTEKATMMNSLQQQQNTSNNQHRMDWKSVCLEYESRLNLATSHMEVHETHVSQTWQHVMTRFAHCMESFRFMAPSYMLQHEHSIFPPISLPSSLQLPRLKELEISYPHFKEFSMLNVDQLQSLQLKTFDGINSDEHRLDRIFPSHLNELLLQDRTLAWVGIQSLQDLHDLRVLTVVVEDDGDQRTQFQKISDKQLAGQAVHQSLLLDWELISLSRVWMRGQCATSLHLNALLIGPNITSLDFSDPEHDDVTMHFSSFFRTALSRSLVFPNLELVSATGLALLEPEHLGHLLGLDPSGVDMFPLLQTLMMGRFQIPQWSEIESVEPYTNVIEEGLRAERCRRSCVYLTMYEVSDEALAQWKAWLKTDGLGFSSCAHDYHSEGFIIAEVDEAFCRPFCTG